MDQPNQQEVQSNIYQAMESAVTFLTEVPRHAKRETADWLDGVIQEASKKTRQNIRAISELEQDILPHIENSPEQEMNQQLRRHQQEFGLPNKDQIHERIDALLKIASRLVSQRLSIYKLIGWTQKQKKLTGVQKMGLAVALFYKRHFDIRNLTDIKHMLEICEMDQNIVIQSDYIYAQKAKKNWSQIQSVNTGMTRIISLIDQFYIQAKGIFTIKTDFRPQLQWITERLSLSKKINFFNYKPEIWARTVIGLLFNRLTDIQQEKYRPSQLFYEPTALEDKQFQKEATDLFNQWERCSLDKVDNKTISGQLRQYIKSQYMKMDPWHKQAYITYFHKAQQQAESSESQHYSIKLSLHKRSRVSRLGPSPSDHNILSAINHQLSLQRNQSTLQFRGYRHQSPNSQFRRQNPRNIYYGHTGLND